MYLNLKTLRNNIFFIFICAILVFCCTVSFASTLFCDLNSDGNINSRDIALLQKCIAQSDSQYSQNADLNGDGNINSRDLSFLQKFIANPKFTLPSDIYGTFPIPKNNELHGKLIFVDAGHGIGNGGVYKDFYEHTYNLSYAKLVKESLENCGAKVVLTRSDDNMVENYSRMAFTNKIALEFLIEHYSDKMAQYSPEEISETFLLLENIEEIYSLIDIMDSIIKDPILADTYFLCPYETANGRAVHPKTKRIFEYLKDDYIQENVLFVSIHTNAPGNPGPLNINGTVTYYIDNEFNKEYYSEYPVENNSRLAQILLRRVSEAGGFYAKDCDTNDFFMIRETTIPSTLVEVGYHTNASDREKILNEKNRKRVANAIVISIMEYFGFEV